MQLIRFKTSYTFFFFILYPSVLRIELWFGLWNKLQEQIFNILVIKYSDDFRTNEYIEFIRTGDMSNAYKVKMI